MDSTLNITCPSCGAPAETGMSKCTYCNANLIRNSKITDGEIRDIQQLLAKRRFNDAMQASAKLLKENPTDSTLWIIYIESLINGCSSNESQFAAMLSSLDSLLFFLKRHKYFNQFDDPKKIISLIHRIIELSPTEDWELFHEKNTIDFNDLSVLLETINQVTSTKPANRSYSYTSSTHRKYVNNVLVYESVEEPQTNSISLNLNDFLKTNDFRLNILILIRVKMQFATLISTEYQQECLELAMPSYVTAALEQSKHSMLTQKINVLSNVYAPFSTQSQGFTPSIILVLGLAVFIIIFSILSFTFILAIPASILISVILTRLNKVQELSRGKDTLLSVVGYVCSFMTLLCFIPYFFVDYTLSKRMTAHFLVYDGKDIFAMKRSFQQGAIPLDNFLFLLY